MPAIVRLMLETGNRPAQLVDPRAQPEVVEMLWCNVFARLDVSLRLARWLGPWTPDTQIPPDVEAVDLEPTADRPFPMRKFRPARHPVNGALFLVPGLHPRGPFDPRLDRLARVLASSGFVVASPLLPGFSKAKLKASVIVDTQSAMASFTRDDWFPRGSRPGVIGLSVGSLPSIALCGSEAWRQIVSGLILFGGYADWNRVVEHSISAANDGSFDPLNRPAIYLNVAHAFGLPNEDLVVLENQWRSFVLQTWGISSMRARNDQNSLANEMASKLPSRLRDLFIEGALAGNDKRVFEALATVAHTFEWLDPTKFAARVVCRTLIAHGSSDTVVPVDQASQLHSMFRHSTDARLAITGLFAHSGQQPTVERIRASLTDTTAITTILSALTSMASPN